MVRELRVQAETQMRSPSFRDISAALVGALKGPSDLGRNHDKYLTYPDRDETSGAVSA